MAFTVALATATPAIGDVKANLATVLDALRRERADLVVFPELFLSGYLVRDGLANCAVSLDGPVVRELEAACRATGKHLVVGTPRALEARGVIANSLLLVGPEGILGHYDKTHLPTFSVFEESLWFRPGTELPVFETTIAGERVRLGLSICYDLFFPEVTKAQALAGADVLVCASASPSISRRHFEAVFPARAIENTAWLLYTNLAGPQDALHFWGGAQAWSPRGERVALGPYDEPAVTPVRVDLESVSEMRAKRPTLRDTRSEILRRLLDAGS